MNPYDIQDLSDEQLEAIAGGGDIVVYANPTISVNAPVVTQVATDTSIATIAQVAVVAASINSTANLKAQVLNVAQGYNWVG
jgi:hypothetical protein